MRFLKKVRAVIAGPVIDIKTGKELDQSKHGFDLGDIDVKDWSKILKALGIKETPELTGKGYQWKGPDILIVTGNDPISGNYMNPKQREPEVGYLSYVGVEGKPEKVKKAVDMLKKYGSFKDESPGERQFI